MIGLGKNKIILGLSIVSLLIYSCNTNKSITGTYRTKERSANYMNLDLKTDSSFVLITEKSMLVDSVYGKYTRIINNKYLFTNNLSNGINFRIIKKDKLISSEKLEITFYNSQYSYLIASKIIILNPLKLEYLFEEEIIFNYKDKIIVFIGDEKLDFSFLEPGFSYKIVLNERRIKSYKTFQIDFSKNKKIKIDSYELFRE